MPSIPPNTRKYKFSPEMTERVREVWGSANSRRDLREGIGKLAAAFGFPRTAVNYYAKSIGLTCRPGWWTKEEVGYLRMNAGILPMNQIAKYLHRSYSAVKIKASELELSLRAWHGYSLSEVKDLFHVGHETVSRWVADGWLSRDASGQFTQAAMERLLREHMDAIELRRIDQDWLRETLKAMLSIPAGNDRKGYDEVASEGRATKYTSAGYGGFMASDAMAKRQQREAIAA